MIQPKDFYGPNAAYILELYERYLNNPASVDPQMQAVFSHWSPEVLRDTHPPLEAQAAAPTTAQISGEMPGIKPIPAAVNLAQAIRTYGHLGAQLDPLGTPPPGDPDLNLDTYALSEDDLRRLPATVVGGPVSKGAANALEAIRSLQSIYQRNTGYEYGHIRVPAERQWLRDAAEYGLFRPPLQPIDGVWLLERLTQVEAFEHFLHRIFPGKTRFSIEGVDMLVPMLDELVSCAAESGVCTAVIGMAHRGRLNVLAHILGKPYDLILAEFRDPITRFSTHDGLGWTGDVKYHKGGTQAIQGGEEIRLVMGMPPNPSHLEHIDPVVQGIAYAAGSKVDIPGKPQFFFRASLPILIHGDASFPGQGVVAETLNLSRLPGYSVGGTIHIITNNQLGYTTLPREGRSTSYASDLAKGFQIPILHVNADDPEACLEAVRTAFAYRDKFQKDFMIDLIGYRRYGHNEGDEPTFTQPVMYTTIESHPSVRQTWGEALATQGQITPERPEELFQQQMNTLQEVLAGLGAKEATLAEELSPQLEPPPRGAARRVDTGVSFDQLCELNKALLELPPNFHVHRKLVRGMQRRKSAFDDPHATSIDWATAEELALASILADAIPIRFTGEDAERGTFSHRHAVFHDVENGEVFVPLQNFSQARAAFEIHNSPLSENAALGFEFGYNIQTPRRLVIWEAQYGDFINTAQAMIDEFIVSARAKWEQTPSLVMLLPHGNEGQGPDHSSGRPERFLELAADINLRLANCTSAAQYFHLLRRQALLLETDPLPLVILTPKSLLRNPLVSSTPLSLAEGRWQPVIDDDRAREHPDEVTRMVLCSGKVYVDLVSAEARQAHGDIAIVRLEQIYPFPSVEIQEVCGSYPHLKEVLWVQEEPQNMGAWDFIYPLLLELAGERWPLRYVGRPRSASSAEGSSAWHATNQKGIIAQVYA